MVAEVAGAMNKSLQSTDDIFADLFDHIYKLSHTRDLCFLPSEVNTTIRLLFNDIYIKQWQTGQNGSDYAANATRCISDLEEAIVSMWFRPILKQVAPTLNNIRMIAESLNYINTISLTLRRPKFSDSCLKAMFTIRGCAACSGYHTAVPCDGNCLNILRGCMYEAVELIPKLRALTLAVKGLTKFITRQLHPVPLTADVMSIFYSMVKHTVASVSNMVSVPMMCVDV